MNLGYEDWEFNIKLGSNNQFGKRLAKPLFHYNVSSDGMLISKSSKHHGNIVNYIMSKYKNLYSFKSIIKLWIRWRKIVSSYPLILFFPWLLFVKIIPKSFLSRIFIFGRNFKWLFTRSKIIIYLKNYTKFKMIKR